MRLFTNKRYLFRKRKWHLLMGTIDFLGMILFAPFIRRDGQPKEIRKILLAKIDHFGDVVLALAVIPIVRKAFPHADIHFLVGSWALELIKNHPQIAKVITYDNTVLNRSPGLLNRIWRDLTSGFNAIKTLRKENYDLGFDLGAYFPNSVGLLFLGQVRFRVGYGTGGFGFLLQKEVDWRPGVHEVEHYLDLIRAIASVAEKGKITSDLGYLVDTNGANQLMSEYNLSHKEPFVIVHPGAGAIYKSWEPNRWRYLIEWFSSQGVPVILTGSKGEQGNVVNILNQLSKERVHNLVGKTNISSLAGVVERAVLVVGQDSFITHLSSSLGIPTVVLWSGVNDVNQWHPIGKGQLKIIRKIIPCSPCCSKNGCDSMECMDISLDEVIEASKEMLNLCLYSKNLPCGKNVAL